MNMQMKRSTASETISSSREALKIIVHEHTSDEFDPISISVDVHGMILDCSNTCEKFFGYRRRDLLAQHVSKLFSELAEVELMQKDDFNQSLVYLCRCGKRFQAKNRLGDTFFCNLNFVRLDNNGNNTLRLIASPADNAVAQIPYSFEY